MTKTFITGCVLTLLSLSGSFAQEMKFYLTFSGVCVSNNAAGQMVSRPINTQTWLNEYARRSGLSSTRGLAVVYHVNADTRGDTIEVVNTSDGSVLDTPFMLFFGEDPDLGRVAITNGTATIAKKIQYVYTYQNSHSMGAANMTEHFYRDSNGTTTNVLVTAIMTYIYQADYLHNLELCNGSFYTGKRFR